MADYFSKKIRYASREYEDFTYLRDDFQDGLFPWGKTIIIISMVIKRMEEGKHTKLFPLLSIPEVGMRFFSSQ